jgi:tetratricopeptide (TPR) repeat protein/tRNA A-37 threonylcarbamoyl transferase component Bud32
VDLQLRMVQAAVEAQLFGRASQPVTVGRYTVQGPIGAGGMGSVVRAHDPELQREVALKLVRAERMGDAGTRARLVQEARAMARLAHPNVAMVFEVAEADGHLYVAMELVDGRDLRAWLDQASHDGAPRPWRAVLELYGQAGRGLAAAHAKGLIHRDFKPENVVVDAEGRARVVDFGLARELVDATAEAEELATHDEHPIEAETTPTGESRDPAAGRERTDLTTTGTLLGTPAYMSPEQWNGRGVDARSDQFSFCVALWEALHGQRPFAGTTLGEIMHAVTRGQLVEPRASTVPRRVDRALRRGLLVDPAERWPDMDALLAALRLRGRGGWLLGGGVALALAGAAAVAMREQEAPGDECLHERERLVGTWDEATRAAAAAGVRATALPYAEDVWTALAPRMDAYASEWVEAAQTSCASALAKTSAAAARHVRQQRCLDEARLRLDQLGDMLAVADEATVVDAANAADRLPDLGACADDRRLVTWADADSPERAEAIGRARASLARAERALAVLDTASGHVRFDAELAEGHAAAEQAQQAAAAAEHAPLQAEAALALGQLELEAGERAEAERSLATAMERAEASGDALARLRARIYQVYVLGSDRDRTGEAVRLGEQSLALLDGLGPRPLLRARLLGNLATAVARARKPDHARALALHHEAIALLQRELGEHHPQLISARLNLGRALAFAGRPEESEVELRAALARAQVVWGDDHPHTARLWGTLGLTLAALQRPAEAEDALRRSLAARERSLGPEHQEVASALFNLGTMLRGAGRHAEAIELLRRGLTIRRRSSNADPSELLPWLFAIGDSEVADGRSEAARQTLREALAVAESDGAPALDFARVRHALARATAPADPAAARVMAEAARDVYVAQGQAERAKQVEAFLAGLPAAPGRPAAG